MHLYSQRLSILFIRKIVNSQRVSLSCEMFAVSFWADEKYSFLKVNRYFKVPVQLLHFES